MMWASNERCIIFIFSFGGNNFNYLFLLFLDYLLGLNLLFYWLGIHLTRLRRLAVIVYNKQQSAVSLGGEGGGGVSSTLAASGIGNGVDEEVAKKETSVKTTKPRV
ncbi:unnamed protein product [Ilex paraguariensis]|uniref:Uncharacterized protein n=1 Tax=Ilex paraguariensis TaxID=185542 RepID=A0ABC8SL13_9AQUA